MLWCCARVGLIADFHALTHVDNNCLESLLYITFARQLVYYQASRGRHSSIENPQGSTAWDLDIVQEMIHASKMSYVDVDLCAWGAKERKDPCKFWNKTLRLACTFNMESLMRRCQKDHKHGIVQSGPYTGQARKSFRTSDLSHRLDIWITSNKYMFLFSNSRTEPSDHPAVDTWH